MNILLLIVGFTTGVIVAYIVLKPRIVQEPIGYLRIDNSDPEDGPLLFLQIPPEHDTYYLKHQKYVTLEVKVENFVSQN